MKETCIARPPTETSGQTQANTGQGNLEENPGEDTEEPPPYNADYVKNWLSNIDQSAPHPEDEIRSNSTGNPLDLHGDHEIPISPSQCRPHLAEHAAEVPITDFAEDSSASGEVFSDNPHSSPVRVHREHWQQPTRPSHRQLPENSTSKHTQGGRKRRISGDRESGPVQAMYSRGASITPDTTYDPDRRLFRASTVSQAASRGPRTPPGTPPSASPAISRSPSHALRSPGQSSRSSGQVFRSPTYSSRSVH